MIGLGLLFGSAVIRSGELNIGKENFETLENVMQIMMWKHDEVKDICELFGDNLYENRPI